MKALVRPMFLTLVLGLLVAVSGVIGPGPKTAQATVATNVAVVNTPDVNVANMPTVNAQQAGPWNVGINGIPTVNVASLPPVSITPPALTAVVNIDDQGRIPFQSTVNQTGKCPPGGNACFWEFGSPLAGHRVVIQHISGAFSMGSTPSSISVFLNNGSGLPLAAFFAPFVGVNCDFDQQVQAYFDSSQIIEVQVNLVGGGTFPNPADSILEAVTVFGYELDCSAAPCAPIAR